MDDSCQGRYIVVTAARLSLSGLTVATAQLHIVNSVPKGVSVMPDYVKPVFSLFLIILCAGISGGIMAANRGRNVSVWCLLCVLLPPFLLFLYFARPLREIEGIVKKCSKCGELIKMHAPVCRYCKSSQTE